MKVVRDNTWTLVADGGQARIFRLGHRPGDIEELQRLDASTRHTPSRDMVSDANSRSHDVRGPGSHVKEPRSDARELAEQHFTSALMERVKRAAKEEGFSQLIIAADPRTLGRMRKCMPETVAGRVVKQLNLDLTGLPSSEIDQRIRAAF
jgi:protein required for attachment to host cells